MVGHEAGRAMIMRGRYHISGPARALLRSMSLPAIRLVMDHFRLQAETGKTQASRDGVITSTHVLEGGVRVVVRTAPGMEDTYIDVLRPDSRTKTAPADESH